MNTFQLQESFVTQTLPVLRSTIVIFYY